ncbi:MAG: CsbD family protein [Comamonadaceae bacterium]|nr:MAG: CsbD family protein [Comamonadaceae bacterium]
MFEKAEGTVRNLAGHVQEAVGNATGDASTQADGKANQFVGKAQETYGELLNDFRKCAVANPVSTVAVVAGIAFVLGALSTRR